MKPVPCSQEFAVLPLATDARLEDILAALTARMSDVQRHAFHAKMAEMDRELGRLSPSSVTLGSA